MTSQPKRTARVPVYLTPVRDRTPPRPAPAATAAEIAHAMERFNRRQGKLRISLTHACQLRCSFCHQEGIEQHWTPTHIDDDQLSAVLASYARLGGRFVELTGGEPLLHPRIAHLLEVSAGFGLHSTLCTNGLLLRRVLPQLRKNCVQLVKVSLHAPETSEQTAGLLGRAWSFEKVSAGIRDVLDTGAKVQLLFTLTESNFTGLRRVLDHALHWAVDVQLVDLIRSRNKDARAELGYLGPQVLEKHVLPLATLVKTDFDRTGATLKIFRTPAGAIWEVKDTRFGLYHSEMCSGCRLAADCGEGVYALRVDPTGRFKPCLLREDLDVPTTDGLRSDVALDSTIGSLIHLMVGMRSAARGPHAGNSDASTFL